MKKKILFFILLISVSTFSQCPIGNLTFENQSEIDQFKIDYPNCTKIDGYLSIQSSTVTNFSAFSEITDISGSLIIYQIENIDILTGFEKLEKTGGLDIQSTSFKSLEGLKNLTTINGHLNISYNFNINDISGLSKVSTVQGNIGLRFMDIIDLRDLDNIDYSSVTSIALWGLSKLESINSNNICTYYNNGGNNTDFLESNSSGFNTLTEIQNHCNITLSSIEIESSSKKTELYPNPVTDILYFQNLNESTRIKEILLLNSAGKHQQILLNNNSINLQNIDTGIYFIKIEYINGSTEVTKIIKQ